MARIAFLFPSQDREDMLAYLPALAEKYRLDILEARSIRTEEAIEAARQAVERGAGIIVARGLQAELIRNSVPIPLVPIRFTAQEVGMLAERARGLTGKASPTVGLVGHPGMFHDVSHLGELLHMRLLVRCYPKEEELILAARQLIEEGAEVLIGGDTVCRYAAQCGLPAVFIASSPECVENACRSARRMADALDLEKRNAAKQQILMDYTVNGLILIDSGGAVRLLNHSSEQLLGLSQQNAEGMPVWELLPALTRESLAAVFQRGEELTTLRLRHKDAHYLATFSPFLVEGRVDGAVISIADRQQLNFYANRQRKELFSQGFTAPYTFDTLITRSSNMRALLEQARRCARFRAPVIIQGEFGTEKEELAQCIHNASENGENAFVHFNCGSMPPEAAEEKLFGSGGLVERAQGALFLDEVSRLSPPAQYRLYRVVSGRPDSVSGPLSAPPPPLRVLVGDSRNLQALAETGQFRRDLFYALNVTLLSIPPLRERKEDIPLWANHFLQFYQKRYGRYIHLTRTAWQWLGGYPWPGNLTQLRNLCQRLVVGSPKRTVDQFFLETLLGEAPPPLEAGESACVPASGRDPNAERISKLLAQCHGNRSAVAQAMGISTTTLWRRMKKYGIQG